MLHHPARFLHDYQRLAYRLTARPHGQAFVRIPPSRPDERWRISLAKVRPNFSAHSRTARCETMIPPGRRQILDHPQAEREAEAKPHPVAMISAGKR